MSSVGFHFLAIALVAVSSLQYVQPTEYVPVFMWGATTGAPHKTRALSKTNSDKFSSILTEQLDRKPFTVVFVEETLSVEDFTGKDGHGRTPYPGLHEKLSGDSVIYLPFVHAALPTLNKLADPEKVDRVHLTDEGLSADIAPGSGQFLYINLKDARDNENRFHMLRRHDEFMTEMFDKLLMKHDSVLAIYTSRFPSWEVTESYNRQRRALLAETKEEATPLNGFYNVDNKVYLYTTGVSLQREGEQNETVLANGVASLANDSASQMQLTLKFQDISLLFNFVEEIDEYWYIKYVNVSEVGVDPLHLKGGDELYAGPGFSYHCSPATIFTDGNSTLTFKDFQVQPFFGETVGIERFELAYDCQGFTTVPIWSGLFVVFLLLFITSIGVTMMMDIRTMDRFDDPKGKTITVLATD